MKFSYVSDVDGIALSFHLVYNAFLEVDGAGVDVAVRDKGEQREEDNVGRQLRDHHPHLLVQPQLRPQLLQLSLRHRSQVLLLLFFFFLFCIKQ